MKFKLEKVPRNPSPAFPEAHSAYWPAITVGLSAQKDSDRIYLLALIDSGAADCIFHADFGRQIGLKVEDGPTTEHLGVGGQKVSSHFHYIFLEVGGHKFPAYVGFSDQVQPKPGLLGISGFFDKFKVTFDIRRETMEIAPYR